MAATKRTKPAPKIGRPPNPRTGIMKIRYHGPERIEWTVAAALCGMSTQDWIAQELNAAAARVRKSQRGGQP